METNRNTPSIACTFLVIAIVLLLGFQLRGSVPKAFSKKNTTISFFSKQ